ncbi:SWIM zinc finger family protein [Nocardia sp. NPDC050710]|uniref:SWIM zinc finger family protein n=1 Tax=Nocardia sp. NPDC050710 TaxID=3157220 RepID=UPI0033E7EFA6
MTTRWTETQVSALAPDASALAAARKLAGRWRDAGYRDRAVWGLCQGSGAHPYQTVVDLSGPAYRCSCPSRKFPCKHALSLLLRWSAGAVPESATVADFAAGWIADRAARADRPARENATRTPNPATAEQRRVRVTAGLEELDIWLGDQVRTGLAQTDRSYRAFETIAARMVDAQAPAVAAALRQLPSTVVTRADWPELMLREYARLHLLIAAHRRLDELPAPLAASVRTHIGYPTATETVRAEPALRDHWMVLGSRTTEEERLYTRRTWLYGRHTHRWALLIDHCFGSPGFANDVPALGTMADAALHYYPAAAPLRALWGERHGTDEPFTGLPRPFIETTGADAEPSPPLETAVARDVSAAEPVVPHSPGTPMTSASEIAETPNTGSTTPGAVAIALEEHARALGADPWLRSWPMLLRDVVPVPGESGWQVVDSAGAALPVAAAEQPWRLVGISGGHPVTLTCEWTGEGLIPVSVFVAGEVVDIGGERESVRTVSSGAAPADSGADLTSVALLGTARRAPDPARLIPPVAAAAGQLRTEPALLLLESAALRDAFTRAGVVAGAASMPEPAPEDLRRPLPPAAAERLAGMLRERSNFLAEWFDAAEPHDFRAPDALCSLVLEHAVNTRWRTRLLRLAGSRGRWLAAQHPEWRKLKWPETSDTQGGDTPDADVWRFGGPQARRDWLADLRRRDPAAARGILTAAWPTESGAAKADLLATLEQGISAADENLLEAALDDRRAEVRRTAAGLLALLPDSAFARRMIGRAATWIRPIRLRAEHGEPRMHLVIELPDPLDADAHRDGIFDRGVEFPYRWAGAPDAMAGRLRQLVAATPLHHWETLLNTAHPETSGATPPHPRPNAPTQPGATPPPSTAHPETSGATPPGGSTGHRFGPEQVTRVGVDDRFRQPLFDGWVDAALAQRDPRWAHALFEAGVPSDLALLRRRELFALLPLADRTRHLLRLDGSWLSEIEALLPAMGHPWPEAVAQHLILLLFERARIAAQHSGAHGAGPAAHRSLLAAAAAYLPVTAAPSATAMARRCDDPSWERAFDQLAHDLNHRSMMLEELQ